jgi:Lecithin retinol acyltransferase
MQDELPLGAHLTTPRWGYLHHGIYAGSGRVIHYAGFNRPLRRGPVEEVALTRFTRGRLLQVKVPPAPQFSGAAAVERARSRLGENRYRFWSNNCEHLVEWCISGRSRSAQVDAWVLRLRGGLRALDALFAARRPARSSPG